MNFIFEEASGAEDVPPGRGRDAGSAIARFDGVGTDSLEPDPGVATKPVRVHLLSSRSHDGQVDARD